MTREELAALFLDNQDFICYIVDPVTYEVLYSNKRAESYAGEDRNGKCYEVLRGLVEPCKHCTNHLLLPNTVYQWEYHNVKQDKFFTIRDSLVIVDGRKLRLELAFDITARKEKEQTLSDKLSLEETLVQCIHTLAEEENIQDAVNGLLAVVGKYYQADRAYIFEFDYSTQTMSNTYEWCATDEPRSSALQNLPLAVTKGWLQRLRSDGAIYLVARDNWTDANLFGYDTFLKQDFRGRMIVPLEGKNDLIGFLGIDNPRSRTGDFKLLRAIPFFVLDDLSKRWMKSKLEHMSYVDILTGLGNRNKYTCVLQQIENEPPQKTGVVYVDINGLKAANDKYGHDYGDHLISSAAEKVNSHFPGNTFRIGGDEFLVLCHGMERHEFEEKVATLRQSMKREDEVSFSIGSNWSDGDIDVVRQIMRADELMYVDKQNYYKTTRTSRIQHCGYRCSLARELLEDIRSGKFVIHLQPKVYLATGKISSAEALVRRIGDGKEIPPIKFIPIYESGGIIRHLDFFVLNTVCATLTRWNSDGIFLPIAVNLSRITLMENNVVENMREVCDQHGVDPRFINIEVTESVEKMDSNSLSALLAKFREHGFSVSLDDFGSEYSNLAILTDMDFDEIKVDKSLIHNICTNNKSRLIVEHAIQICHSLGLTNTVAEGIETLEQKALLEQCGCTIGQGYLFSKPVPIDDFYKLYREQLEPSAKGTRCLKEGV